MISEEYLELTDFINKSFITAGMIQTIVDDKWPSLESIFRHPDKNHELFILLGIGCDFRDPDWSIDLRVGKGFPENEDDPVEFQLSTISLTELGILDHKTTGYLPADITKDQLQHIFKTALSYCIDFINGFNESAIYTRNDRNRARLIDPLELETQKTIDFYKDTPDKYSLLLSSLSERNEELRLLLKKYIN